MKKYMDEIVSVVVCVLITFFIFQFILAPVNVSGESMYPQLQDEEKLIGLRVSNVNRFNIVTFVAPDDVDKQYVKRIIGLPGESITYKDNQLYIDGVEYEEPYLSDSAQTATQNFSVEIPKNSYFVLGDNRGNSKDSRYFGAIDKKTIKAKMIFSFYPFDKVEWLL